MSTQPDEPHWTRLLPYRNPRQVIPMSTQPDPPVERKLFIHVVGRAERAERDLSRVERERNESQAALERVAMLAEGILRDCHEPDKVIAQAQDIRRTANRPVSP